MLGIDFKKGSCNDKEVEIGEPWRERASRVKRMIVDLDARKRRLAGVVKWALVLIAAAVIAPIIYLAVKGLVGLALAGIVGLAIVNFAPVVSMKFANWKLRAMKSEAARNPIETLQNQQAEKERDLKTEAEKINAFDGAVETFRSQLMNEAQAHPESAAAGVPTLRQMERLLSFRRMKFKRAADDLRARRKKVELAESRYRVALAAQAVTKAAGETEGTVLDKILEDIAFTAVEDTVNTSMAALRTAIMVEEVPADDVDGKHLDARTPLLLETPAINERELMAALAPRESMLELRTK